jgi:hypothetical protein
VPAGAVRRPRKYAAYAIAVGPNASVSVRARLLGQHQPGDGEGGGAERGRADPPSPQGRLGGQHDHRRGADREQRGQADPEQRDGREVAGLEGRGEAAERGDPAVGGPSTGSGRRVRTRKATRRKPPPPRR